MKTATGIVFHPIHCGPDGHFIQAEDTIFRIPLLYLGHAGVVLSDAYCISRGALPSSQPIATQLANHNNGSPSNSGEEGTTIDNPILLPETAFEVGAICDWLFHTNRPHTREAWLAILAFSCKYEVIHARADAMAALDILTPALRPAHKLALARSLAITEWKDDTITILLKVPAIDFILDDFTCLTPDLLHAVSFWRAKVHAQRCHLVSSATPVLVQSLNCNRHRLCEVQWDSAYRAVIRFLIRPEAPLNGREIYQRLINLDIKHEVLHSDCLHGLLESLQLSGLFWRDEIILECGRVAIREIVDGRGPNAAEANALAAAVLGQPQE